MIADDPIPSRIIKEDADATIQETGKSGGFRSRAAKKRTAKGASSAGTATRSDNGPLSPKNEADRNSKKGFKLPSLAEIPGVGKGKTLSSREADQLKEGFRESLEDDFGYIDQWLRAKTGKPDLQVWSDVDTEELDKVTEVFLRGAQRSPILATVVRETINTHDYIVVGMVFLPRLGQTVQALRDSRKVQRTRPSRWERMAQARQQQQAGVNGNE